MEVHCRFDKMVSIKELKLNPANRNKHPEDQIKRLAEILKYQGWRYPVKVSKQSGLVTSGHGRIAAAKLCGWKEVPVNFQDYATPDQEYADTISDNSIASWAELDLPGINADLSGLGPDFNLDLLGIKDFVLEPADKLPPGCDEDAVPEKVEPKTKPGDIYQLGNHRVMCGDSTNIQHVEKLMAGEKADMVFTDPPYNVNYGVENTSNPAGWSNKNRNIKNDNMTAEQYLAFSKDIAGSIRVVTDGCVYVCAAPGKDGRIIFGALDESLHCSTTIIWNKSSMVMGRGKYHNKYEPIWFGWVESGKLFTDDRTLVNVWDCKRPTRSDMHPTMKPVELIEMAINHASKKSVCDLFGGSGSTLIAAEKTNRKAFVMELDPHYVDVIVARFEKYSGKKARLLTQE